MAKQVELLAAKPDRLSSVPSTHVFEGENNPSKLSSESHLYTMVYVCVLNTHTIMCTCNK